MYVISRTKVLLRREYIVDALHVVLVQAVQPLSATICISFIAMPALSIFSSASTAI
jgi:hypothetical protein